MAELKYRHLKIERLLENQIFVVKFCRPENLNAMNRAMMDELVDLCSRLEYDPAVRVVVFAGEGSSFMAGADIKEYASADDTEFFSFQRQGVHIYRLLEECSLPVIAAVQGYALGGGMEIALACDLILASEESQLGLPEVHLGLVPGGGGTQRLIQKIGLNRAKEMLFTGDRYSSQILLEWGIVNQVLPEHNFMDEALSFAAKLCRRSKTALTQLKQLLRLSVGGAELAPRIFCEGQACFNLFRGKEAKSKINAFASKGKSK